jgi:hypothetical protein
MAKDRPRYKIYQLFEPYGRHAPGRRVVISPLLVGCLTLHLYERCLAIRPCIRPTIIRTLPSFVGRHSAIHQNRSDTRYLRKLT